MFKYFVFKLHTTDKHLDPSIYILNFTRFYYFCVAHYKKNFVIKLCMLLGYINGYVQIYIYNFLNLKI
jgi:hypothetical protein